MAEVVVIGGGLAGAAAATLLGRAGREVVLLERSREAHDKVCGEFLSAEALFYLARLGVDVPSLGALAVTSVKMYRGCEIASCTLPFAAMSLTRRVLDEALLCSAAAAGVIVRRGVTVEALTATQQGWVAHTSDGSIAAPVAVMATGKHDLRGKIRGQGWQGDLVAFNQYFRLPRDQDAALRGRIELHLFRGGYAGLQRVEDGSSNLGLLVTRSRLRSVGGWAGLRASMLAESPALRERLGDAAEVLAKPLALSSIPYGFLRRQTEPALWWVGDQAAVIPSFSGDGMSIALHTGMAAAESILAGEAAESFTRTLAGELSGQIRLATLLSVTMVRAPLLAGLAVRWPGLVRRAALSTRVALHGVQREALLS